MLFNIANHPHAPFAADNFAFLTEFFNRCSYFHDIIFPTKNPLNAPEFRFASTKSSPLKENGLLSTAIDITSP